MSDQLLRVYLDPAEIGPDGYPYAWRYGVGATGTTGSDGTPPRGTLGVPAIKDYIRELAGHRCVRCGHPYPPGITETCPKGEWTPCDERCDHLGPWRIGDYYASRTEQRHVHDGICIQMERGRAEPVEAHWRILTTHHLNGVKHDCRWWNLVALCQRCHLQIQGRVDLNRVYIMEHSEWFRPYAAGWYAWSYLGEELSREETMARLDELLALERMA